jgi:mRNA interferase RelE/StbE
MQTSFRESFWKDVKHCNDQRIKTLVNEVIRDVERAKSLGEIKNLKKLKGFKTSYRIRIADYRLGLDILGQNVEFIRLLNRKEIYRYFP